MAEEVEAAAPHHHHVSKRRQIHATLQKFPVKFIMNVITIVLAIIVDVAIIVGLISLNLRLLHWIVAVYLFCGSLMLIISSGPVKIRQFALKWFLFLSTYNGKSAFLFLMALLMFGLGIFPIIVGIFLALHAINHILLWVFFRDLITDEKPVEQIDIENASTSFPEDYTYSGALGGDKPESKMEGYGNDTETPTPIGGPQYGGTYGANGGAPQTYGGDGIPPTYDSTSEEDEDQSGSDEDDTQHLG